MKAAREIDLQELFRDTGIDAPAGRVSDLSENSRRVSPGTLFLACAGERHHGLQFLPDALRAGATAVAWEPVAGLRQPQFPAAVTAFQVPGLSRLRGQLADRFFAQPSAAVRVTGITGTNGKTTVAWLVAQALASSELPAAYSGTLGYGAPPAIAPTALTTPDCIEVHRRLREFADDGAAHAVLEVSSHALDQGRVDRVRFAVAALTNISRDHLDYHGDMAAYVAAKASLFREHDAPVAVINLGDERARSLRAGLPAQTEVIGVALVERQAEFPGARLLGRLAATHRAGIGLQLSGDFGDAVIQSPLWGRCNAENLVVAAGILVGHGLRLDAVASSLAAAAPPPGRLERLATRAGGPEVVVDFAHSPDALRQALLAVRDHCAGRIWCVFGCGGERDAGKRAPMGQVAESLADRILLTDDNPRAEDPDAIIAAIRSGIGDQRRVQVIRDRASAIRHAVTAAVAGDVVLIAGKGHETVQIEAGGQRPFSDREVACAALERAG